MAGSRLLRISSCERGKNHGLTRSVALLDQRLFHCQEKTRCADQQLCARDVSSVLQSEVRVLEPMVRRKSEKQKTLHANDQQPTYLRIPLNS